MGTNSTGCTEWERDYDPMTERPVAYCTNGHLLDYPNQLCNICLQPVAKVKYNSVKEVPTDILAHNVVGSLILCKGSLNKYKDVIELLIRELRDEPHPKVIQDIIKKGG